MKVVKKKDKKMSVILFDYFTILSEILLFFNQRSCGVRGEKKRGGGEKGEWK